jgi:hypothetical protein
MLFYTLRLLPSVHLLWIDTYKVYNSSGMDVDEL